MRFVLIDHVHLVTNGLVVHQHAILHQVPFLCLDAFVVVFHITKRMLLGLVGNEVDDVRAVLELARAPLIEGREAGPRVVRLVAQYPVELQRVTHRLVDGEHQVMGVEHQIVLARLHRTGFELGLQLFTRIPGVLNHVVGPAVANVRTLYFDLLFRVAIEIFVTTTDRITQTVTLLEARSANRSGKERCPHTMHVLVNVGTVSRRKELLLVDLEQHRGNKVGAVIECRVVGLHEQVNLVFDRHLEGVLLDRGAPLHFTGTFNRCELHRLLLELGVGFGHSHCLTRRVGDRIGAGVRGGCKAPGTVGDHADANTSRLGVDDVIDPQFTGGHELVQVATQSCVGVGRTGFGGGSQRDVGETLLLCEIHAGLQHFFGADGATCDRQYQACSPDTGEFDEFTSVHAWLPALGEKEKPVACHCA